MKKLVKIMLVLVLAAVMSMALVACGNGNGGGTGGNGTGNGGNGVGNGMGNGGGVPHPPSFVTTPILDANELLELLEGDDDWWDIWYDLEEMDGFWVGAIFASAGFYWYDTYRDGYDGNKVVSYVRLMVFFTASETEAEELYEGFASDPIVWPVGLTVLEELNRSGRVLVLWQHVTGPLSAFWEF